MDPNGIATRDYYDLRGDLTQTIADYTDGTARNSSNQVTDYIYDGDNNLTMMESVVPGAANQVTSYVYGVNTSTGSVLNDNDLLAKVEYPDPTEGNNTAPPGRRTTNPRATPTTRWASN